MFDIGFLELILVSIVGLLVLGPDRLPGAIRTVSLYIGKLRRSFNGIRAEIERELKADEIRQELHNQAIMRELRETENALRKGLGVDDTQLGKDGYPLGGDTAQAEGEPRAANAAGQDAAIDTPADTKADPSTDAPTEPTKS
jgi:sec-independent protein translocase protein TatB